MAKRKTLPKNLTLLDIVDIQQAVIGFLRSQVDAKQQAPIEERVRAAKRHYAGEFTGVGNHGRAVED